MDWEDLYDWVAWLLLALVFVFMLVLALIVIVFCVYHAIKHAGSWLRRRRRRGNGNNNTTTTTLSIDELLESIPDMAYYQDLPPDAAAGDHGDGDMAKREREVCAICVTPYEAGETCSLLPGCAHMFHKPCVTKWLRKKNTCPLCRATVGGGGAPHPPRRQAANIVNSAENMV